MILKDLDLLSVDELWALHLELIAVLASKMTEEKAELEKRLAQLNSSDVPRKELRERRAYPAIAPKFRNPSEPLETWTGRGKTPRWLSSLLKSGRQIDDFRIATEKALELT